MIARRAFFALSKRAALLVGLASLCVTCLRAAEDRLWVPAKVNGKPVKLAFDTGAEATILFRETAERLGLRVTNAPSAMNPSPGRLTLGRTETCDLTL